MPIYVGMLRLTDGTEYNDIWVHEEDAMSYYSHCTGFRVERAELFEYAPDEDDFQYQMTKCLYEYDVNGKYYYK